MCKTHSYLWSSLEDKNVSKLVRKYRIQPFRVDTVLANNL